MISLKASLPKISLITCLAKERFTSCFERVEIARILVKAPSRSRTFPLMLEAKNSVTEKGISKEAA